MSELARIWPPFGVELRSPRLRLSPVRDDQLPALVDAALSGIHDPSVMPFSVPWTDAPRELLIPETLRYQWRQRASFSADEWTLNFAVVHDGQVIGMQDLSARDFALCRTVRTGSWLARTHQGRGLGLEMRAAVLLFAFDHLAASSALTEAADWNQASLRVSRKLGYEPNGVSDVVVRPGEVTRQLHLRLTAAGFRRPDWALEAHGVEPLLPMIGAS